MKTQKQTLLVLLAALLTNIGFPQVVPLGRVACWHAEGNSVDGTGGNNGSLQGGVTFTPGTVGDAFSFDGASGFIDITNNSSMDFGAGDFTIVAWLRFNSLGADQEIIHKVVGSAPDDQAYYLEFNPPDLIRFAVRDTATNKNDLFATAPLVADNWYLVAAVRNGNTNAIYLNGNLIGSQASGVNVNSGLGGTARIGRLAANGVSETRYFSGDIDELSLYNRALSVFEIQGLFNAGNTGSPPDSMNSISFQGALNGLNGQPLPNGNYNLTFTFYDVPISGIILGSSTVSNIVVAGGIASAIIPVSGGWFDGQTRYLGISINGGQELTPRVVITSVPYALKAAALAAPNPFDSTSHISQQQGLELRWYQDTPFIDFTGSPNPSRDYDYRIYCASPSDPRLVFKSDIAANALVIRRNGFLGIGVAIPGSELDVNGTATMTVCRITSDRNTKTHFASVTSREILTKLAALPISTWAYTNAAGIRHIGPVAQDFRAAFGVGDDDKHIATVDADGVALAAIQGLNQKLESELSAKDAMIQSLVKRLEALESKLESQAFAQKQPGIHNEPE
jgi:hypothetical protein